MAGVASKNVAQGPVAAHIFESPGTYSVCLSVKDRFGAVVTPTCQTITVDDPDTVFASTTVCINAVGSDFTGCPGGATQVTNSAFNAEMATQIAAGKRRILFKRGDTFSLTAAYNPGVTGPGIIGAFGSGAKPKILNTTSNVMITFNTAGIGDWRLMDLELDGNDATNVQAVQPNRSANRLTFLRLNIHHINVGFNISINTTDAFNVGLPCTGGFPYTGGGCTDPVWDQLAVQDTEIWHIGSPGVSGGGNGAYWTSIRGAVMGNRIEDATYGQGEHIIRIPFADRHVVSHNYLAYPKNNKSVMTTRGPPFPGGNTLAAGAQTQYVVHSYNKLVGGSDINALVVVLPVIANIDYHSRYLIYERNLLIAGSGTQAMMQIDATSYGAIRNNVFNGNGTNSGHMSFGSGDSVPPAVSYLYIYNNTFLRTTASPTCTGIGSDRCGGFTAIAPNRRSHNVHVKNNLVYAPLVTSTPPGWYPLIPVGVGAPTQVVQSGNSTLSEMLNSNPNFINASGTWELLTDYKPNCTGTTYPCGRGVPVPVWSDLLLAPNTNLDIGAVAH
jgi:hypothetical protein